MAVMSDESPLEKARAAATRLGLTGEDFDDFVEAKMRRAGYKRGPGDWVSAEDSDYQPQDDDDQPMTRGEWRQMQHENRRKKAREMNAPPKKDPPKEEDGKDNPPKKSSNSGWWKGYENE